VNHWATAAWPPWYTEGLAELLATHQLDESGVSLARFPASRDEVPGLGRIGLVQDALARGQRRSLNDVLLMAHRDFLENDAYAWSWALVAFLDGHPAYRDRFHALVRAREEADPQARFRALYADDWPQLETEFAVFVADLEHAYDFARTAIDFDTPLSALRDARQVRIAADRGWQNSGIQVVGGKSYRITARGRYEIARTEEIWWCEPGGVSIRYYHGWPLGRLLAAIGSDEIEPDAVGGFLAAVDVGLAGEIEAPGDGTLFLRVNDSAAELADNRGTLEVEVVPAEPPGRSGSKSQTRQGGD
jgi:hypothetical protein